jgi:hypothetical protein
MRIPTGWSNADTKTPTSFTNADSKSRTPWGNADVKANSSWGITGKNPSNWLKPTYKYDDSFVTYDSFGGGIYDGGTIGKPATAWTPV